MPSTESPELGTALLDLARGALHQALKADPPQAASVAPHCADTLDQPGATFVTLTQDGQLRGCIGSLQAWRPLRSDVQANAVAAGLSDPRFAPLRADELIRTRVEVSLLSAATLMAAIDEGDALAQLRPGVDGVILEHGRHRATFLPQVWEQLPERHQFLAHLKHKAGLSPAFWAPDLRLHRYTVTKWKESM